MNHPKFEVGEEVILESKKYPDLNGEYSIRQVLSLKMSTFAESRGL